jgi:hypothetical protein
MEKVKKYYITRFTIFTLFLGLVVAALWIEHGFKNALHTILLTWSLFILCIPANHGKIIIGLPARLVLGKPCVHTQIITVSLAVLINLFTYLIIPAAYFSTILTHLLLRIISNPWPYWSIILVCALGTLYKSLIGTKYFYSKKLVHYPLRTFIILSGIFIFFYFSYKELVILLNVRAI